MPKFSANLSFLYTEFPFLERFAAAAEDGFEAVEYVSPFEFDKSEVAIALSSAGLVQALFNTPCGNWSAGERGIACLPERIEEFRLGVPRAIEYAEALGCMQLNVLAGVDSKNYDQAVLEDVLVSNLKFAANECAKRGIRLLIEPINQRDIPGFQLSSLQSAERVMAKVASDNLFLQFDFYHVQVMDGHLVENFKRFQNRIAHVQIADNPGRHAPGTGEINYGFIFSELDRLNYGGWVGCEYIPETSTRESLSWMTTYRIEE